MTQYNFLFINYTCIFSPVFLSIFTFISIAPDLPYFKFSTLQYLRILFCPYEYLKTASLSFSFILLRYLYCPLLPSFLPVCILYLHFQLYIFVSILVQNASPHVLPLSSSTGGTVLASPRISSIPDSSLLISLNRNLSKPMPPFTRKSSI